MKSLNTKRKCNTHFANSLKFKQKFNKIEVNNSNINRKQFFIQNSQSPLKKFLQSITHRITNSLLSENKIIPKSFLMFSIAQFKVFMYLCLQLRNQLIFSLNQISLYNQKAHKSNTSLHKNKLILSYNLLKIQLRAPMPYLLHKGQTIFLVK